MGINVRTFHNNHISTGLALYQHKLCIVCTDFHFYFNINEITPQRNVVFFLTNQYSQQNKMNDQSIVFAILFSF